MRARDCRRRVPLASMSPANQRAVCVVLHDVAPATWPGCQRLLQALDEVAGVPVTLFVVPDYPRHGPLNKDRAFTRAIEQRLARGDEVALHGYYHLDDAPRPRGLREHVRRRVYTRQEGEFAALDVSQARERLEKGLDSLRGLGWPVRGFVPPAWLMNPAAWQALQGLPFSYTSTLRGVYDLPSRRYIPSRSLVYSVGSAWRRWTFRQWNAGSLRALQANNLLRLGLHPIDANYPQVIRSWQDFLEKALRDHRAMTKAAFVQGYADGAAQPRPAVSGST